MRCIIAAIHLYQRTLSPLIPGTCRFYPTCSHYAEEAFRVHGLWKGFMLSCWRLMRCQPFCRGGFDPVPPKKAGGHSVMSGRCLRKNEAR